MPEHDRELAVVDDLARLERVGDDPEPALARAAVLRVDVVLQLADALAPAAARVSISLQLFFLSG